MPLVELKNISKVFKRSRGARALFSLGGITAKGRKAQKDSITALKDINLDIEAGEYVGLIGANGSGKSTLLKIIAGVTLPSAGHVEVRGSVASLLELGAGFSSMLTGRENIYLNAGLLGMRRRAVNKIFDQIVDFSGIEAFIDDPVNTYSSGMFIRLAFSVAIHSNPDIFLLDEILAVGDEDFQQKCRARITELKAEGKTLIFVSHDLGAVSAICDRCYLLREGVLIARESPQATIDYYVRQVGDQTGVHTFSEGPLEAIFSHGRLSLFRNGHEVTAPRGIQFQLLYTQKWYFATNAQWVVVDRRDNGCTLVGHMRTLPIIHHWDFQIENGGIHWKVTFECTREIALEEIEANFFFPTAYTKWTYESLTGEFPDILPSDLSWVMILEPGITAREASALPDRASLLPPLYLKLDTPKTFLTVRIQNADYPAGSRIYQAWGRFPPAETPLAPGTYEIMSIDLELSQNREEVDERVRVLDAHNAIHTETCTARIDNGRVRIHAEEKELTAVVFLHTSILIDNLWTDSHHLDCGKPHREDGAIHLSAPSPRFPFVEHFEIEAIEDDVAFRVWFEALEDISIDGYHISIGLQADYDRWESCSTSGSFPEAGEGEKECSNSDSDTSEIFVRALSSTLPNLALYVDTHEIPFRMEVRNSGAKVIQARRTFEGDTLDFPKGRHPIFTGRIVVQATS